MANRNVKILVVDDDPDTRDLLSEVLEGEGYQVVVASGAKEALAAGKEAPFEVILSDIRLGPELSGLDVLRAFKSIQPDSEVILITAFGSMETAIEAVKAGAFDYLSKPFKIEDVLNCVRRALESRNLVRETRNQAPSADAPAPLSSLVGRSPSMLEVYKKIGMVADSRAIVLITGESGTGKELVARAIHANGPRVQQRFLAVNCGAFTESLLESELFGHVRGSFTGASVNKVGIFEDANGGTVFLDEVSEMSPALQVKLLRTLEAQEVRPVGSNQSVRVDVRMIAASNQNLADLVSEGSFREDLYYRLRVIEIDLPPLRERAEDIPLLVAHFLQKLAAESGRTLNLAPEALSALIAYPWPGNVRELLNTLESVAALNRSGVITLQDLPAKLEPGSDEARGAALLFAGLPSLEELGRRYLNYVLKMTGNNKSHAADILGISRNTLYRMTNRLPLEDDKP
ncbi:MAG: sigma-54-dependent Fis family transcriptional regulator [Acidobacteria bacterium]|nr:MAG: sigma-54-dependent Fis family transcriptional regulator [Acidobacteriota bacterium]